MGATDARPVPRKGVAFRLYFAYRAQTTDVTYTAGDLITDWSSNSADAEMSGDGGAFTGNATYIGTPTEIGSSGVGYVEITATGMNYDCVIVKATITGGTPVVIMLYPEEEGDYRCNVVQWEGADGASAAIENAVWDAAIGDHTTTDTYGRLQDITADRVWDEPYSGHALGNTFGGRIAEIYTDCDYMRNTGVGVTGMSNNVITSFSIANNAIDSSKIATGAIDADALATDAVNEIAAAVNSLNSTEVAQAVWNATMSSYDTPGTTGHALVTASGNLMGGFSASDIWSYSTRSLTDIGSTSISGQIQDIVVDGLVAYDVATKSHIVSISGSILDVNVVQVSGEPVILSNVDQIADAVWDEDIIDHRDDGSTGLALITASGNLISGDWSVTGEPLTSDEIRLAVGLSSANLDAQLGNIPTVSEFNARTLVAADYFDPSTDTVANVTTVAILTGHTPQTGDSYPIVDTMEADIKAYGDSNWGTADLTNIGASGDVARAVWEHATRTLSDKTGFELASDGLDLITGWTVDLTGNLSGSVGSVSAAVTTDSASRTASQADVSNLATTTQLLSTSGAIVDQIGNLNNFDPAIDVVAHVTLVDTTTTNSDMRGTDNAALATELAKVPKSDGSVSWNSTALAAIEAEALDAIQDYDAATGSDIAGLNDISASDVWVYTSRSLTNLGSEAVSGDVRASLGLASANLDTQLTAIDNYVDTMEADLKTYGDANWSTADLTEVGASGDVAQAVWEYTSRSLSTQNWSTHIPADVVTALGTGSNLTQVGLSSTALNNVQSEAEDALAVYDVATRSHIISVSGSILNANIVQVSGESILLSDSTDIAEAVWDKQLVDHRDDGSAGLALITASGNLISGNWSTISTTQVRNEVDASIESYALDEVNTKVDGIKTKTDSLTFSGGDVIATLDGENVSLSAATITSITNDILDEPVASHTTTGTVGDALIVASGNLIGDESTLTADNVADAVWQEVLQPHTATAGSAAQALVTASGTLIGGDGLTIIRSDISSLNTLVLDIPTNAEFNTRTLPSGEYLTAKDVWEYSGDKDVNSVNASGATPQQIWEYGTRTLTGTTDANIIQVSGQYVSLNDFMTSEISVSGLATTSQLQTWGLLILNNCGGGDVS